jgi:hypothetical protein
LPAISWPWIVFQFLQERQAAAVPSGPDLPRPAELSHLRRHPLRRHQLTLRTLLLPEVYRQNSVIGKLRLNVMNTIFGDSNQFSAKKLGDFLKNQC